MRIKTIENRKKINDRVFVCLFSIFFLLISSHTFVAQDSIPEKEDLSESAELKFQQYFFKALSQKSIGNHTKAIQYLESCNQILPENKAVFFEFSKNYLALKKTMLAKEYIERALTNEPNNIWMLKHLVTVYEKGNDLDNAIKIQEKIVGINPKEREDLVRLFLYNRNYDKASELLNKLKDDDALTPRLKRVKASLESRKRVVKVNQPKANDLTSLMASFKEKKSYQTLKKILALTKNNEATLLKYSNEGINLFPAQPFVYLSKARALVMQEKYKEALDVLENGIDFVIEEKMEADFFTTMAKAYKGLGNLEQEKKYNSKAKKIKS